MRKKWQKEGKDLAGIRPEKLFLPCLGTLPSIGCTLAHSPDSLSLRLKLAASLDA